ncbi:hypothetical protein TNCV_3522711 [Trichonephila clavipes]|uniref:Uncharacterized protein n=1 Tax=Trichonephila clavipes TaxID=2585209 RepID=A0A8X6W905_TRICX|nr:hypothetical protein TNCV_3522711 [Trichonephila clavipes]
MISEENEFAVGDIEKLFDEARHNTKAKHEKWAKYYNQWRRDVRIKVNDWVLVKTHPLSSAAQKVVAKFKPKFQDPYRVLEETLGFKRSWQSGSGGPERKCKGPRLQGAKRKFSVKSNDLPNFSKRYKRDETVMRSTSGCDQEEVQRLSSDQSMRRGHNKEDRFDPVEAGRNNSTDPIPRSKEGQVAGIREAEVVNNKIARRGNEERTATDPSPWKSQ